METTGNSSAPSAVGGFSPGAQAAKSSHTEPPRECPAQMTLLDRGPAPAPALKGCHSQTPGTPTPFPNPTSNGRKRHLHVKTDGETDALRPIRSETKLEHAANPFRRSISPAMFLGKPAAEHVASIHMLLICWFRGLRSQTRHPKRPSCTVAASGRSSASQGFAHWTPSSHDIRSAHLPVLRLMES